MTRRVSSTTDEAQREEVEPKTEEKVEEEAIEVVEEKMLTIPFGRVWVRPHRKRTPAAIRYLKAFVKRHMKGEEIKISNEINETVWSRGISKPPRKLRVKVVKDKEGSIIVYPAETKTLKTA